MFTSPRASTSRPRSRRSSTRATAPPPKFYLTEVNGEIEADPGQVDSVANAFNKTAVTASLPSGVAKRWYYGANADSSGVVIGMRAVAMCEDVDTGAARCFNVVIPRMTLAGRSACAEEHR